jgi:hypothetical protein
MKESIEEEEGKCVCVCERERERERESDGGREICINCTNSCPARMDPKILGVARAGHKIFVSARSRPTKFIFFLR